MSAFSADDVKNSEKLRKLLEDITNDPSLVDKLPEDELAKIENLVSPYGTVAEANTSDTFTCLSFTNLRKDYIKKLLITALIGYLYRRCDEYGRAFRDTVENMDDMEAAEKRVIKAQKELVVVEQKIIETIRNRNNLDNVVEEMTVVEKNNQDKYNTQAASMEKGEILQMREYASLLVAKKEELRLADKEILTLQRERDNIMGLGKRFIIRQFLDEQFKFNPDKHVRSSYSEQKSGPTGTTYVSKFVPPDDTFHNFQYYLDSNYEELCAVAHRLYKLKPDLDVGIIPYASFATEEEADSFVERNKGNTIASILTVRNGKWNFLESYKANRDRIEAYRGTIVEDILEQVREDTKLGAELTRDRAIRRRTENIKESKPDPKIVRDYMSTMGHSDPGAGDQNVKADLTPEEQERIWKKHQEEKRQYEQRLVDLADEKEERAPHDVVRVNVLNFSEGGKNLKKSHFYTKAKAPNATAVTAQQGSSENAAAKK
jgi:hypothetical protein